MNKQTILQKLIAYIADADVKMVEALYTILESKIEQNTFKLSDEELQILEMEEVMHLAGKSKSYNREEANQIIRGQRHF